MRDYAVRYGEPVWGGRGGAGAGRGAQSFPRDRYLIATKLYFPVGDEPDRGFRRRRWRSNWTGRCERLGVDVIDLYQCHRYEKETPLEETLGRWTGR